jgi:hypothetical protein
MHDIVDEIPARRPFRRFHRVQSLHYISLSLNYFITVAAKEYQPHDRTFQHHATKDHRTTSGQWPSSCPATRTHIIHCRL